MNDKSSPVSPWERVAAGAALLWVLLFFGYALMSGCTSVPKTRNVELDGMLADATSLAIGSVDVMAAPSEVESAIFKYEEDTAWLSPSTKIRAIKIQLSGSNSVSKADTIIDRICRAIAADGTASTAKKTDGGVK